VSILIGVGEQGQGTEGIYAQITADAVGISIKDVRIVTGDTDVTPYGGGTWASRGAGVGGEAVAPGAVMNAINDALAPFEASVFDQPITGEKILRALGKI